MGVICASGREPRLESPSSRIIISGSKRARSYDSMYPIDGPASPRKAAQRESRLSRLGGGPRGIYYEPPWLQQIVVQDNDGTALDDPMALIRVHGTLDAVVLLLRVRRNRVLCADS